MKSVPMIHAVEGELDDLVVRKLVATVRPDLPTAHGIICGGKPEVLRRAESLNATAKAMIVFILVDQDVAADCPPTLIRSWLNTRQNPNLIFRVAVMSVEAWLLAHREEMAEFLHIPESRIPIDADSLERPKQSLVNLARKSRNPSVLSELVPTVGSTARVGPYYTPRMSQFVADRWNPRQAAKNSPSLLRAIRNLERI